MKIIVSRKSNGWISFWCCTWRSLWSYRPMQLTKLPWVRI